MTQYLLAADADKIQDLLFRSSRLREVVGGSALLAEFCEKAATVLASHNGNATELVVHAGGSFRMILPDEDTAWHFARDLADAYREQLGGTLTVAEPVPMTSDFHADNQEARKRLEEAKRSARHPRVPEQSPPIAFCGSCGVGLAEEHKARDRGDGRGRYLCDMCLAKYNAGLTSDFLKEIKDSIVQEDLRKRHWPTEVPIAPDTVRSASDLIAQFDARGYVAYLVADGNRMGKVFSASKTKEQMKALSEALERATRKSLTHDLPRLVRVLNDPPFLPLQPLILGGDDCFALVPARYALDYARRFCQAFEEAMAQEFQAPIMKGLPLPSMSAAVVICKSNYPYRLAHERGERLLKEAKRFTKNVARQDRLPARSVVNFAVILGNNIGSGEDEQGDYRPSLRPYWLTSTGLSTEASKVGIGIDRILQARLELKALPATRRAALRDLYAPPLLPREEKDLDHLDYWRARLNRLCGRITLGNPQHRAVLDRALRDLGSRNDRDAPGYWWSVPRDEESRRMHGLPDVLEAWDYAWDLDRDPNEYEERER